MWHVADKESRWFNPSDSLFMINYRVDYLDELIAQLRQDGVEDDLPEIQTAADVWRLITGLHYVWVNEDATVNVDFSVTFDPEHELHVRVDGSAIERVWME